MAIYIFTFFLCLFADKIQNKLLHSFLYIWLYVFLCFGYTTGSDWRFYELDYMNPVLDTGNTDLYFLYKYITSLAHVIGLSFWFYTALVKCVFLYVLISTIRIFTDKVFVVISLLIPSVLLFMLIDCPFKFMMAMIFVLLGFKSMLKGKYSIFLFWGLLASFAHFAAAIVVLLILLSFYLKKYICKSNFVTLFLILISTTLISTSLSFFTSLSTSLAFYIPMLERKVESYSVESTEGWLTMGNLVNYIFFFIIIYLKKYILKLPYGDYLFSTAILSRFLFGIVLIIPTGFRFNIFFNIIFYIALACVSFNLIQSSILRNLKYRRIILCFVLLYSFYVCVNMVWNSYVYLPYTNSIWPILNGTSDENYMYRNRLGYDAYFSRTGERK